MNLKIFLLFALLCVVLPIKSKTVPSSPPERKLVDFDSEGELDDSDSSAIDNAVQRLTALVERVSLLKQKLTKDLQSTSASLQTHFANLAHKKEGGAGRERHLKENPLLGRFGSIEAGEAAGLSNVAPSGLKP